MLFLRGQDVNTGLKKNTAPGFQMGYVANGDMDTNALNSYAQGPTLPFGISTGTLFASLLWGSIGVGFCIYGKKQQSLLPWIGGFALIGISYVIPSPLWMSVVAVVIIAAIWFSSRSN